MTGKLTEADMDQLETWIGTGPKIFTLLYSITRDGCVSTTFHQKCDNQGPTVTVLYNQQGSVYGGYTSVSWTDSIVQWSNDDKTFLYQLLFSGNKRVNKFPSKHQSKKLVLHGTRWGPSFGYGNDLHTFSNNVKSSGGYFTLNGSMNGFGANYETQGVTAANVNNGNMNVAELEVYKVTDGTRQKPNVQPHMTHQKPWRKTPELNEKYLAKLIEEIGNTKPMSDVDISEFRLLMLGPVGSGKSSFYNTVNSVFRGRVSQRAPCGKGRHSTTTAYTPYEVRTKSGSTLRFQLCDTPGLDECQGLDTLECTFLLDGHIPEFYKFNPVNPIALQDTEFVLKPAPSDKIHAVAFVIDASTFDDCPAKLVEKINNFRTLMFQKSIPQAVILTHIDKISDLVRENASSVFECKEVEKMVEKVSVTFGIPRNSVLPVKNYENEMHLEDGVSILALMALQQLLYLADDYTENLAARMKRLSVNTQRGDEQDVTESDTA